MQYLSLRCIYAIILFLNFSILFSFFSPPYCLLDCKICQFFPFYPLMHKNLMKSQFFSIIIERVYCCNYIDQYQWVKLVSTVTDNMDEGMVDLKYDDLSFQPQIIFYHPQNQKNSHQIFLVIDNQICLSKIRTYNKIDCQ